MTPELTVLLWLWRGWRPVYGAQHVHAMAILLHMFLPGARIVVVTDQKLAPCCSLLVDDMVPLPEHPLPEPHRKRGPFDCWVRLHQCDAEWLTETARVRSREAVLSLDLDCVPVAPLWPMLELAPTRIVAMRSSSAWMNPSLLYQTHPGAMQTAWDELSVASIARIPRHWVGSDQAWLSHVYRDRDRQRNVTLLTRNHGAYVHAARMGNRPAAPVLWSFAGKIKPWAQAARASVPLAYELWHEAARHCEQYSHTKAPPSRRRSLTSDAAMGAASAAAPELRGTMRQAHIQKAEPVTSSPVLTKE